MIVKGTRNLKALYHQLGPGDVFIGTVVSSPLKLSLLIDLLERGICCIPSPLSQCISKSKAMQALAFRDWMMPNTKVISRRLDLIEAINLYNQLGIGPVITKENHMHCGHGVRRWENIEALYNLAGFSESSFPFVLQPFLSNFTDIRVIIVEDYVEAYVRYNPDNFRKNISSGGRRLSCDLAKDKEEFCRSAMSRGKFPYAHLDLLISEKRECYLSEINLTGGIKGARISRDELDQKKRLLVERLANEAQLS
jgi:ribosomal protein S6--L-glutamate ligase